MPCSMAACSTVLPFSTVSGRPSIVSVTVSISQRSYQEGSRSFSDDLGHRRLGSADLGGAQPGAERQAQLDVPFGHRDEYFGGAAVGKLQRDHHRKIEQLALL